MVTATFRRSAAVERLAVTGPPEGACGPPAHPEHNAAVPSASAAFFPCFDRIPSINASRPLLITGVPPPEQRTFRHGSTVPFRVVSQAAMNAREELTKARRLVVKVGSRSLANDHELIPRLAREIAA